MTASWQIIWWDIRWRLWLDKVQLTYTLLSVFFEKSSDQMSSCICRVIQFLSEGPAKGPYNRPCTFYELALCASDDRLDQRTNILSNQKRCINCATYHIKLPLSCLITFYIFLDCFPNVFIDNNAYNLWLFSFLSVNFKNLLDFTTKNK